MLTVQVYGWVTSDQVYATAVPGTPLAAASSYTTASTGDPEWIQLLQISDRGIEVSTWSGATLNWLQPQDYNPSPMANSTANVRTYRAIAMTALGTAFAVVDSATAANSSIQSWEMDNDLTDWTATGTVVAFND